MTALRQAASAASFAGLALLVGCAPVGKQRALHRIDLAAKASTVRTGTITVASRQLTRPTGLSLGTKRVAAPAPTLRVVIDRARRRAAVLAPPVAAARIGATPGGGFPTLILFDHDRIYVRAADGNLVGARPWLAADVTRLGAIGTATTESLTQPRTIGDLVLVSPLELTDLALGVLTGSIRTQPGAPPATAVSYSARTSIEKEFRQRHLDPSDDKHFVEVLRSLAVKDDINPISVQFDDQGALRRLAVDFTGRPEYGVRFATTFDLDLDPPGGRVDAKVFEVPAPGDVVEVNSLGDLRAGVDEWSGQGAAA